MFVAVGSDNQLYTRGNLAQWAPAGAGAAAIGVAVLPDGSILGVGKDNQLYTRATLTSAWTLVPSSGAVLAVTVLADGTILGIGMDNQLYTRATLMSQWTQVPGSGAVLAVTVLPDGTILGIGMDNQLYTRATLTSAWTLAPNSGPVIAVTVLPDGTILGVGTDNQLYTLPALPQNWTVVSGSGAVVAVAVALDSTIYGVGKDNKLYSRLTLTGTWTLVAGAPALLDVGVLADGTLIGVSTSKLLCLRVQGNWTQAPNPGPPVISATGMPDGSIVGVGTDNQLYRRGMVKSPWQLVTGSGQMTSVSALPDGSLLGVGTDKNLYVRLSVASPWTQLLHGGTVLDVATLPDASAPPSAASWLLQFTSQDPTDTAGDGRPWGDGTAMAARSAAGLAPWDGGCLVTPLVGGYAAMGAMRDAFESAIADANDQANNNVPPGQRGHVYIADWLLNGLRDLSEYNAWGGTPWNPKSTATPDQTALGLVVRMMAAGINVRLLLWMPTTLQRQVLKNQADEEWSVAAAIQDYNATLQKQWSLPQPLGVVALDLRTAAPLTASLHQKMVVVRVGKVNVGFCGGVDLAFTRRDFRPNGLNLIGNGDWQSGDTNPLPSAGWPKQSPPPAGGYPSFPYIDDGRFPEDLPANVYGSGPRHWHDHHLKLEGPVVRSVEQQFAERWIIDTNGRVYTFNRTSSIGNDNQVQLTSAQAWANGKVLPLPAAQPCPPAGSATVQMWRTIPLRAERVVAPFVRGEFTVLGGVANAVAKATSLITIWDQYFWSVPLAKLLAARLNAVSSLQLLIVLPPYGTTDPANELKLRMWAMQALWNDLNPGARTRVLALDMWAAQANLGVYVHAKAQTYDDALIVCGSANMNRRSTECDAELDCAIMHRGTVRGHLANLYARITGQRWTNFADGWLSSYWKAITPTSTTQGSGRFLIRDPFFTANVGSPKLPNGVPIPYNGWKDQYLLDPTSIATAVESSVCSVASAPGDPKAPGRMDEVTYLLERCHDASKWPFRVAYTLPAATITQMEKPGEAIELPRLTL